MSISTPSDQPAATSEETRPCVHADFDAWVEVHRLFGDNTAEADALTVPPDSVSVDVRVTCHDCGKAVRFEGPIGVGVGPGARPMVSLDGTELRAAGHLGENRTPGMRATFSCTEQP